MLRWQPTDAGDALRFNLPALPVALYGLDQLSADVTRKLLLCEGLWDAIAADHHLTDKKVRTRYDLLAVPGANVFKEAWGEYFRNRTVRLLLDNDEAGRKGQERAAKLLKPFAADVSTMRWPDDLPKGYDVRDLIRDGESLADFSNKHCMKVATSSSRISFVRGDRIEAEKIEWLWPGHIQFASFTSFSGQMGTHKSGIIRDVAARATAGKPMPNCKEALDPFDVFYLTSEDGAAQVCDLVQLAGGDLTRLHVHDIASALDPIDFLDCLEEIEAAINSYKVRLVVLNALNSFIGGDISTDAKARRTLSGRLQSLARRTGASIIGVRNWGRADVGTSSQRVLGAASLSDVGRCVLNTRELEPIEAAGPPRYRLEFEKVSNAKRPLAIPYSIEDLSTDDAPHLRRIIWGEPITKADVHKALGKGSQKR